MYNDLNKYSEELERSKGYLIRAALGEYLQDIKDVIKARKIQSTYSADDLISFEEVKRKNKLD